MSYKMPHEIEEMKRLMGEANFQNLVEGILQRFPKIESERMSG